jgi:hypothetical protein
MFDQWLNKKTETILNKVDREQITTEEMIILTLKAQTNHFFKIENKFDQKFELIDKRFELIDKRFESIDQKFESIDKRFDRMYSLLMWGFGLMFTSIFGIYINTFLK